MSYIISKFIIFLLKQTETKAKSKETGSVFLDKNMQRKRAVDYILSEILSDAKI